MPFDFNLKSTLLLVFFIHLVVYSGLLFRQGFLTHKSFSWLGLLVFLAALYLCPFMLGYANWYAIDGYREFLLYMPFQQLLLMGPVIFFYTQSLLIKQRHSERYQWLHFLPAFLYLLYSFIMWLTDFAIMPEAYFYADGKDKDLKFGYQILGFTSLAIYLVKSRNLYAKYKEHTLNNTSFAETVSLSWVRYFLLALLIVVLLKIVVMITIPGWGSFGNHFIYYLIFSVLFYFLAIFGYSSSYKLNAHPLVDLSESKTQLNLSDEELNSCRNLLETVMQEQKYYLNQKLTLSELSKSIEVSGRLVSKAINQSYKMNFNDYINSYRVKAFIERYQNNSDQSKTLLDLALDCGFNSKATFNRAFKKYTMQSPKSYFNS